MKQVMAFIKKNYMLCICLVSAILLVFVFPAIEKRGTYGLDNPSVVISCPDSADSGATIDCAIELKPANQKILSVNANYNLGNGVTYQSFTATNSFVNYAVDDDNVASNNGFAVINLDGVTTNTIIGTLTIKLTGDDNDNDSYNVGLKTIELSNDQYEMVDPASSTASDTVTITSVPTSLELQIDDLIVDENKKIITRLEVGTTYGQLKTHIFTNGTVSFANSDDTALSDNDVIKTGTIVNITLGSEKRTYKLSVLGDILGNGTIGINDVGLLYRYYRNRAELDDVAIAAGDIIKDDLIHITDVGRLYRYYRNRVDTLEEDE